MPLLLLRTRWILKTPKVFHPHLSAGLRYPRTPKSPVLFLLPGLSQQIPQWHVKRLADEGKSVEGGVLVPFLQAAYVGPGIIPPAPHAVSERKLGEPRLPTHPPYDATQALVAARAGGGRGFGLWHEGGEVNGGLLYLSRGLSTI